MKERLAERLHFVVLLVIANVASGATLLSSRGAASGTAASAASLVRDRDSFEAKSHAQLSKWCNATLPAQGSRRSALQHLLLQAQSSQPEDGTALSQMESQAASLGGQLERQRLQSQASHSVNAKEMTSLKLDLDDATRDLEALQHAYDKLGGSKAKPNAGLQAAAKLLEEAKDTKRKAEAKVALLQSNSGQSGGANLSQLEEQYRNKKADIVSYQHQLFTTQRSLDVLTSALEDESGYLADLQSICGAESRVYQRLEKHVLPMLREAPSMPAGAAAEPAKAAPVEAPKPVEAKPVTPKAAAPKPAVVKPSVKKVAAKPKKVVAKHTAAPVKAKPAAVKPAAAKPAAVKHAAHKKVSPTHKAPKPASSKPAVHKKPTATKKHTEPAKPVVKLAATKAKTHKKKAAVVSAKHHKAAVKVTKKRAKVAAKPATAHKKAPKKASPAAAKAPPPAPTKMKDPFADDDDDDAAPPTPPAPKAKPAKKAAAKPVPTATPKVKDPFADDDDDDSAAPAPPAAKPVAHVSKPAPKAKKPPPAPAKIKDPFADDDDDDAQTPPPPPPKAKHQKPAPKKAVPKAPPVTALDQDDSSDDAAPPPPPPPAHKKANAKAKAKPKKPEFMDGVYDSAAGNMPSAYSAWKPAGASSDDSAPKPAPGGDPKKSMMSMLGDDDGDASPPPAAPASKPAATPAADAEVAGTKAAEAAFDADDNAQSASKPAAKPTMKDPFADDDADTPPPPPKPAARKRAPKPVPTAAPAPKVKDPFADDDDDTPAPKPAAKPAKAAAKVKDPFADDDDDTPAPKPASKPAKAAKVKDPFADDDDDAPARVPAAKPAKAAFVAASSDSQSGAMASAKAAEAAFDEDDDSFDAKAAFEAAKPKVGTARKAAAAQDSLDGDDASDKTDKAEQSASQLQMPKSNRKQKKQQKKDDVDDSVYDAAAGNLPTQYSAWTPSEQAASDKSQKKALAQMETDFDDDDDAPPTPAPKRRQKHHHREPPAPAPPPPPKPASDGVVYDDDDLPRHHSNGMRGLEGGWQSFMKKPAHKKAKSPKLDPDVAIMESLYTKDGGLPSEYTAWSPDSGAKRPAAPAPKPQAQDDGGSDGGDSMDLEAAAKAFAKDPESAFDFLQVDSESSDKVAEIIHHAIARHRALRSMSFLEASAVSVDMSRLTAASDILEQYAEVLKSKPLRQLAKAKLSPPKLQALYQQLRNVDPLVGKVPVATQGKQAQAEKMCEYFQQHMQAAAPVQKGVALVEAASNALAESVSQHAALLEEIDARTQLQRTMEQDLTSLKSLADLAKQGVDTSALDALGKQLSGAAAMAVGQSVEGMEAAHEELKDLLDFAVQKRSAVLDAQKTKLSQLQADVKKLDGDLAQKKAKAASSQAAMETARKKLAGIASSCDATLYALARRRHAGHMEAHAIEIALQVLGTQ